MRRHLPLIIATLTCLLDPSILLPQQRTPAGPHLANTAQWGDQPGGTYTNPILPADVSDLDCIRVGRDFYAISSTMQYSPGMAILHSVDLVHWALIGHVVDDLTTLDPAMDWDGMGRAGRGIWAGAIRFHKRRFWVFFGTPDQGIFVSTAAQPTGPWSVPELVLDAVGWDDPAPFWDEDGQGYLAATHFTAEQPSGIKYNIHLFRLAPSGDRLLPGFDRILHQSRGSEANKLYKIHGLYYHFYSEIAAEGRVPMIERARSLDGPWRSHQLLHVHAATDKEPNQGGLIELPSRRWFFLTHQGTGDWEGRAGVLLSVTWIDGWPILGRPGSDGIGNMLWSAPLPLPPRQTATTIVSSDEFSSASLKTVWEWRNQPRADRFSLLEHPGFLRLHAFPAPRPDDFNAIPNVLTQRAMRTGANEVTVSLDLSGMVDRQQAGLAHFGKTHATLSIVQQDGTRRIAYTENARQTLGPVISGNSIALRSTWDLDGHSHFSFSLDGHDFQPFGTPYDLTWGSYRGDRIGLFTVNPAADSGYADFSHFRYVYAAR